MRTKAFLSAGVALIALLVSLAPLAAAHEEDVELAASGSFIPTGPVVAIPVEEEEDLCVFEVSSAPFDLTGTLAGSATTTFTAVQEAPCAEIAPVTFEGTGAFLGDLVMPDGTVVTGTFDFEIEGSVDPTLGNIEFEIEIEEGTGGLADLDGELTFVGNFATGIAYSGQLELDD